MTTSDIEKVLTVFRGVGERDTNLAVKYMDPAKFKQHNPHAPDGVDGVKKWISQLPREKSPLKTIRAFQDGPYVVTHTTGDVRGEKVLFEIFKIENGLIVEHWVFSEEAVPANKSGHTQIDGPTEGKLSEDKEKNKSIVRDYYETVHISGDHSKIPQYVSEGTIRHEPKVSDGLAAFLRDVEAASQHRTIDEIKFVLGQGDLVFVAAKGTLEGDPCAYIDLYRVADGKMAEHWGFPEKIPPQEEWKNNNGML
jgi:predicted SnoaL-like aldol condensation-catalyzing enzyme